MLRFVDIRLGDAGDRRCRNCRIAGGETLREASEIVSDIAAAVRDWREGPGPNLSFGGVEPFHHAALSTFVAAAVDGGASRIRLETDCAALADRGVALSLLDAGVRHIRYPLLGSSAAPHDALVATPGAFAATSCGVQVFAEAATERNAAVHIGARVPVCRHNIHDLPATVTAAAKAGATTVLLAIEDTHLDLRSAGPWIEAACDSGVVNAVWVEVEGVPYGFAAGWELHLACLYRRVAGMKTAICDSCPLDPVCGGAVTGADAKVVAAFAQPAEAVRIAEAVTRGFAGPAEAGAMADGPLKVALVALNRPGYQSLALGYLRAYAEANERLHGRVAFQTLDITTDVDPWWVAYRLIRMDPDVVGFSVSCWNAGAIYETCSIIKNARPGMVTVLGGPEVGPIAERVLEENSAVDMVVRGEGEETFAELLRVLASGKRAWMVEGVTARDGDRIVSAADREPIADLDTIPSPYVAGVLAPDETSAYIETYRGCPHACGYCFEAKGVSGIRSFSRARIEADIDAVASSPGVRSFSFIDSVFNLTRDRLAWLADALEPHALRGVRLHTIEVDIERIGDAEAAQLVRAGVVSVETGPQTIGAEALRTSRRTLHADRFVEGVAALKRAGISVECDLIIGLPGDDPFDVIGGLRWLIDLDPGVVQASTLRVLPGTDLCARSEEIGLMYERQADHSVVQTPGIGFADMRRLEVMACDLQRAYRARLH